MSLTDIEKIESGKYVICRCRNVFSVELTSCPFCHLFNSATTAKQCPTCGQTLEKPAII